MQRIRVAHRTCTRPTPANHAHSCVNLPTSDVHLCKINTKHFAPRGRTCTRTETRRN
jgi:hypothetical protein